jgi:hypothetical protein
MVWVVGVGGGVGYALLCLSTNVGLGYTVIATGLFALAAADLAFVLLTGRLRLRVQYESGKLQTRDLRTGRVTGSIVAAAVLVILVLGALPIGTGHTIRTGLDWYRFHSGDVQAVVADSWIVVGALAMAVAFTHAIWRRDWGRVLARFWGLLAFWSIATAVAGGWALVSAHHRWWAYPWFFGWTVVGLAFVWLWLKADETEARKQKELELTHEREEARQHGAEQARGRRERLGRQRLRSAGAAGSVGSSRDPDHPEPGVAPRTSAGDSSNGTL